MRSPNLQACSCFTSSIHASLLVASGWRQRVAIVATRHTLGYPTRPPKRFRRLRNQGLRLSGSIDARQSGSPHTPHGHYGLYHVTIPKSGERQRVTKMATGRRVQPRSVGKVVLPQDRFSQSDMSHRHVNGLILDAEEAVWLATAPFLPAINPCISSALLSLYSESCQNGHLIQDERRV